MIRKRFISFAVLSFAFFGLVVVAIQAKADNAILNGLRQGANLAFGTSTPQLTQSTAPSITPSGQYVAMGDSVAAGLGLYGTSNACGRTDQSYANAVAIQTGLPLANFACSGATSGDLVTKQGVSGPNITAQLDSAYASGAPSLITVTAGANDLQWERYIRKCYAFDCGTKIDNSVLEGLRASVRGKLAYAMNSIHNRSNGQPPQVILTGYYNPVSAQCANAQFTPYEIAWVTQQFNALNADIAAVANAYSFVTYAPVDFTGHDVCSSDPWVQTANDPAPLHPTAVGQQVIAQSVLNAYRQR